MAIIEFPKVKVDIKQSGYDNPGYLDIILGEKKSPLASALAYALWHGVENTRKFVGATFDEYLLGAENMVPAILDLEHSEWKALNVFVQQFAAQGWVYAAIERKNRFRTWNSTESNPQNMIKHLQGQSKNYDHYILKTNQKAVNSVFFVPSPTFTEVVWGFGYDLKDLETVVKVRDPEEK